MQEFIDKNRCIECNICNYTCVFTQIHGYKSIDDVSSKECISCGHCVAVCSEGAVSRPGVKIYRKMPGKITGEAGVMDLIYKTRTFRKFKDKKLSGEQWDKISEVLQYSQSGTNNQIIDLLVINSTETRKKITKAIVDLYSKFTAYYKSPVFRRILKMRFHSNIFKHICDVSLLEEQRLDFFLKGNDNVLFNAPSLILFIGDENYALGVQDATLAAQNIAILASSMELGICLQGMITIGYDMKFKPLINSLNIPSGKALYQAMVIGYPDYNYKYITERRPRKIDFIE